VGIAPSPVNPGTSVVITVDATSNVPLRAASFFRDVNANGGWDAGIDQALGDSFTQVSAGRFQKSVVAASGWAASTRIVANVVDTAGAWGTPRGATLTIVQTPVVTGVSVSPNPSYAGATAVITVDATWVQSLRAASFFRDVNGNGGWDVGVDQALGDSFTQVSPGRFQKSITVGSNWGASARIVANVVDVSGAWGGARATTLSINLGAVVTGFGVTPGLVNAGGSVVATIDATSTLGLRAASFFRDVNGNGAWDAGVDQALGDSFTQVSPGRFQRTIVTSPNWDRTTRIVANVVDTAGVWSIARTVSITVNHAPVVSTAYLSASSAIAGQTIRAFATGSDDAGIQLMTAYIDVDGNGSWTGGEDVWLADDTTANGSGVYEFVLVVGDDWPASSPIRIDALDSNGLGSGAPRLAGTLHVNVAPVVQTPTYGLGDATPAQPVNPYVFTATATDNISVAAVTFWLDLDNNGVWTPNVDQSLGESRTKLNGTNDFRITVYSDLAGLETATVLADAMDSDGAWTGAPRAVTVTAPRLPHVIQFLIDTSNNRYTLGAEGSFPAVGEDAEAPIPEIEYVADVNFNGVRDDSDVLIAVVSATTDLAEGWRHYYRLDSGDIGDLPASYQWLAIPVFTGPDGESVHGAARVGIAKAFTIEEPLAMRVTAVVGLDQNSNAAPAIPGNRFHATADGFAPTGVQAVKFFWDRNVNGILDAGTDIDLGTVTVNGGMSAQAVLDGTITEPMIGPGAIGAIVRTVTMSGERWSPPRSQKIDRIISAPIITLAGSSRSGNQLTIDIDAWDDFGVKGLSGYLDTDGNGIDDGDPIYTLTRISGGPRSGRWRVTINVSAVAAGSVINLRGMDFYRGAGGTGMNGNVLQVVVPA
jgi:hypothetical protein